VSQIPIRGGVRCKQACVCVLCVRVCVFVSMLDVLDKGLHSFRGTAHRPRIHTHITNRDTRDAKQARNNKTSGCCVQKAAGKVVWCIVL